MSTVGTRDHSQSAGDPDERVPLAGRASVHTPLAGRPASREVMAELFARAACGRIACFVSGWCENFYAVAFL